ncbi:MAG: biopolymer transporter ExbD [Deltaproteobacteria bacterium]|nr:biopolymer transporter ExbD [Deltaproteobacteria bacterium]
MFKRPSNRRSTSPREIQLNLVPVLDALVTLIAFLLFTSAFLAIVAIDTPAPMLAPPDEQLELLKEKPLQLTAYIQAEQILVSDWSGSREAHKIPSVPDPKTGELRYDIEKFHQTLLEIKSRHPDEAKLIVKPEGGVSYESLIGIMDAARAYEKSDAPLFRKDPNGMDIPETRLFPEIIFGNLLG